jgi:hypothetical protein
LIRCSLHNVCHVTLRTASARAGASELLFWNIDDPSRPRLQSNGGSGRKWHTHTVLLGWDVIGA